MVEFFSDMVSEIRDVWRDGVIGKIILSPIIIAVILLFAAIGCSILNEYNHLDSGMVIDKQYCPTHPQVTLVGKVPVTTYIPESYQITITDGEKQYITSVDEEVYDKLQLGDQYRNDKTNVR